MSEPNAFLKSLQRLLDEINDAEVRNDYSSLKGMRLTLMELQNMAKMLYPSNAVLQNLPDPLSEEEQFTLADLLAVKIKVLQLANALNLDLGTAREERGSEFSPAEIARKVEMVGVSKAKLDFYSTSTLAILAGAFISLGGMYFTLATSQITLSYAFTQIIGGTAFSLGLILVVIAGAELFTGNNLVMMAFASRKITLAGLLRNWGIVYAGNFLGSILTAAILYMTNVWIVNSYQFGVRAVTIANSKVNLDFTSAFFLGILCNTLVCLAIWLAMGGRSVASKILAIIFPISAFVAIGFEHSVANMYFIPFALLIKDDPGLMAAVQTSGGTVSNLDLTGLFSNLLPVSLGNIVGGSLFVGLVYWLIYLRKNNK